MSPYMFDVTITSKESGLRTRFIAAVSTYIDEYFTDEKFLATESHDLRKRPSDFGRTLDFCTQTTLGSLALFSSTDLPASRERAFLVRVPLLSVVRKFLNAARLIATYRRATATG